VCVCVCVCVRGQRIHDVAASNIYIYIV
jgi:hypothetical protein